MNKRNIQIFFPFSRVCVTLLLSFFRNPIEAVEEKDKHPSTYEFACLSAHAYKEDLRPSSRISYRDGDYCYELSGWKVVEQYKEGTGFLGGYRGTLFYHPNRQQVVLVHRGTDPRNLNSIKTDALSVALDWTKGQSEYLPTFLDKSLKFAKDRQAHFYITGHSLGGWLAQVSMFILQTEMKNNPNLKKVKRKAPIRCVTFDTPGAGRTFARYKAQNDRLSQDYIINYLSAPNPVNSCQPHIGRCYRLVFDFEKNISLNLSSHLLSNFIKRLKKNQRPTLHHVQKWPMILVKDELAEIVFSYKKSNKSDRTYLDITLDALQDNALPLCKAFKEVIQHTRHLDGNYPFDHDERTTFSYHIKKYPCEERGEPHCQESHPSDLIVPYDIDLNSTLEAEMISLGLEAGADYVRKKGHLKTADCLDFLAQNSPKILKVAGLAKDTYDIFKKKEPAKKKSPRKEPTNTYSHDGKENRPLPVAKSHPYPESCDGNPFSDYMSPMLNRANIAQYGVPSEAIIEKLGNTSICLSQLDLAKTGIQETSKTIRTCVRAYADYKMKELDLEEVKEKGEQKLKQMNLRGDIQYRLNEQAGNIQRKLSEQAHGQHLEKKQQAQKFLQARQEKQFELTQASKKLNHLQDLERNQKNFQLAKASSQQYHRQHLEKEQQTFRLTQASIQQYHRQHLEKKQQAYQFDGTRNEQLHGHHLEKQEQAYQFDRARNEQLHGHHLEKQEQAYQFDRARNEQLHGHHLEKKQQAHGYHIKEFGQQAAHEKVMLAMNKKQQLDLLSFGTECQKALMREQRKNEEATQRHEETLAQQKHKQRVEEDEKKTNHAIKVQDNQLKNDIDLLKYKNNKDLIKQNLPDYQPQHFIKREELLSQIEAHFSVEKDSKASSTKNRYMTLYGWIGSGKTTLACHYAHKRFDANIYRMAWWIDGSTPDTIARSITKIAKQCGYTSKADESDRANLRVKKDTINEQISKTDQARHKRFLIVWDNLNNSTQKTQKKSGGIYPNSKNITDMYPNAGGDILFIARNKGLSMGQRLWVGNFTSQQAYTVLCKYCLPREDIEKETFHHLIRITAGLPLSIAETIQYMENIALKNRTLQRSLHSYVPKMLNLQANLPPVVGYSGEKNFQQAFQQTLALATRSLNHPASCNLLHLLAYCAPDGLPHLLLQRIVGNEIQCETAISHYQKYGLLQEKNNGLAIHPFYQALLRYQHKTTGKLQFIKDIGDKLLILWARGEKEEESEEETSDPTRILSHDPIWEPRHQALCEHLYTYWNHLVGTQKNLSTKLRRKNKGAQPLGKQGKGMKEQSVDKEQVGSSYQVFSQEEIIKSLLPNIQTLVAYYCAILPIDYAKVLNLLVSMIKVVERDQKKQPTCLQHLYVHLGDILMKLQQSKKAIEAYEKALEYSGGSIVLYDKLASAYLLSGQAELAQNIYEKIFPKGQLYNRRTYAMKAEIYCTLAGLYLQQKKQPQAIVHYQKVISDPATPQRFKTLAHFNLAELYEQKGDLENAIKHYQIYLPFGELCFTIQAHACIGSFHLKQGQYVDAANHYYEAWEQAVDLLETDHPTTQEIYAQLLKAKAFALQTRSSDPKVTLLKHLRSLEELLLYAVQEGSLSQARFLLQQGANHQLISPEGDTLLHIIAKQGHCQLLELFLKEANPIAQPTEADEIIYLPEEDDDEKEMEFFSANNQEHKPSSYNTSLIYYLPLNILNSQGHTPLKCAILAGKNDMARTLIHYGGQVDIDTIQQLRTDSQALNAEKKQLIIKNETWSDLCKWCLERENFNVDLQDDQGNRILHKAAKVGDLAMCRYLVKIRKAEVNKVNKEGKTPLHIAASHGHTATCQFLIEECNAEVHKEEKSGKTPMHVAAENDYTVTCKYLIEGAKADVNKANRNGYTALYFAAQKGHTVMCKFLVEKCKADVKQVDKKGGTPLHIAAQEGHTTTCQYLVEECNMDVNQADKNECTPLHIALWNHHKSTYQYLLGACKGISKKHTL